VIISGTDAKKRNAIQYILHSLLTSIHGNCHGDKSTAAMFIKLSEINNKEARYQNKVTQDQMLERENHPQMDNDRKERFKRDMKGLDYFEQFFFSHWTFVNRSNLTQSKPSLSHFGLLRPFGSLSNFVNYYSATLELAITT